MYKFPCGYAATSSIPQAGISGTSGVWHLVEEQKILNHVNNYNTDIHV